MEQFNSPVCPRYLNNRCPHDDENCFFKHSKDGQPLCMSWQKGICFRGNGCRFRHFYLDCDGLAQGYQRSQPAETPDHGCSATGQFSSPYVVKVHKLVEKERKVEIDLETGKKKSWVEVKTQDLIDLTGQNVDNEVFNSEDQDSAGPGELSKNCCNVCKKKFRGPKGVKQHQRMTGCGDVLDREESAQQSVDDSIIVISDDSFGPGAA